jgi:hypothetical protein
MIITTQTITTWFVFSEFSGIPNKALKNFQSIIFCSILSLFILTTVFIGQHELALAGAILEALINFYYYARYFWVNGFGQKGAESRKRSIIRFWRRYWLKMIFGAVIPALIYGCSWLMMELQTV